MSPEGIQPGREIFRPKEVTKQGKDKKRKDPITKKKFAEALAGGEDEFEEEALADESEDEEGGESSKSKAPARKENPEGVGRKLDLEA